MKTCIECGQPIEHMALVVQVAQYAAAGSVGGVWDASAELVHLTCLLQ